LVISREKEQTGVLPSLSESQLEFERSLSSRGSTHSRVGTQESLKGQLEGEGLFCRGNSGVNFTNRASASGEEGGDTGFNVALDDLEQIGVLGCGSSGVVRKVKHKHTGDVLALKVIQLNVEDQVSSRECGRLKLGFLKLPPGFLKTSAPCLGADTLPSSRRNP